MHIVKGTVYNAVPFTMCIVWSSFPYWLLWNICAMIRVSLKSSKIGGTSMAGSSQSKKSGRKQDRLGPGIVQGASRVSKVVGGEGSQRVHVEQRANRPGTQQGTRNSSSPAAKRASRQGAGKQAGKKAASTPGRVATPASPLQIVQPIRGLSPGRVTPGAIWNHITSSASLVCFCWYWPFFFLPY